MKKKNKLKCWVDLRKNDPIYILTISNDMISLESTKFIEAHAAEKYWVVSYFDDNREHHHWTFDPKVDDPTLNFFVYNDNIEGARAEGQYRSPIKTFFSNIDAAVNELNEYKKTRLDVMNDNFNDVINKAKKLSK